jgi:hypothetical protein
MDPIEVTAHFDQQGKISLLQFTWNGSIYRVESTGRHWLDDEGQHLLAMVASGIIYELIYKKEDWRWYLKQVGPSRMVA